MTEKLELKALTVSNVLCLKAVHLEFDGNSTVVIGGKNGAGKTSIITALKMAIAEKAGSNKQPVREGADKGVTIVDMGKFIATHTMFPNGKETLKVTNREGAKYSSPRALLKELIGDLSFDPLEFARQSSKEQVATLCKLTGLDFTELDATRKAAFEKRTDVNRDGKRLAAQLEGMPKHDDAPAEKVSVGELVAELDEASKLEKDRQDRRDTVNRLTEDASRVDSQLAQATSDLQALTERVEEMKAQANEATRVSDEATANHAIYCTDNPTPDTEDIKAKIAGADEQNQKLAQNEAHAATEKELTLLRKESKALGEEIDRVDAKKRELLAAAKLPVEGMSFGDGEVTVHGRPFENRSISQRTTASFLLGIHGNSGKGKLPLAIINDGSLLDEETRREVCQFAKDNKVQLIMEVVGNSDDVTVLMENGAVVEAESEVAA